MGLYYERILERYRKMRQKSVIWVLYNYDQVMHWKRDSWLQLLVHDAQVYARAFKNRHPEHKFPNVPNTK